jgi:myo-inositol-1(or 4)-monophosphatase
MTTETPAGLDRLDLPALCEAALAAVRAGGAVVAEHFGAARGVREKAPGDWVSEADFASERAVREVLTRETGLPVFGEEAGGERSVTGWLVDPLDGTANFLHHFDAVGVSVGLVHDGRPVVGVVDAPLLGRTYHAFLGGGAFRDGVPMTVSDRAPDQAIVATGFPFRRKDLVPLYLRAFESAFTTFEDLRRVGGASLDLCWTAEGVFDGFFELRLAPWDVAAGGLIVREAGGVVTGWSGEPDAWVATGDILAGSPAVHEKLLEMVQPLGVRAEE